MRGLGLAIVVLSCISCTSSDSGSASTITVGLTAETRSPVSETSVPATVPADACAPDNDALAVAKTFIVAAETGDQATIDRCIYPAAPLSVDLISIVASGGWLLDEVRPVTERSALTLGPSSVGFDFPAPPEPRGTFVDSSGQAHSLGPDHQSGVQIAVTLEPDGRRYVTDVLAYASA